MSRAPNRRLAIAPMTAADLDAVMDIERESFAAPWDAKVFAAELDHHDKFVDLLRGSDGKIVGFTNYWLVHDEVHLLNIAVAADARRQGHGETLLEHVLRFAQRKGCRLVTLEVRRSNQPARRLYRKYGFRAIGIRPNYYENREDAIVMLFDLNAESE